MISGYLSFIYPISNTVMATRRNIEMEHYNTPFTKYVFKKVIDVITDKARFECDILK